MAVLLQKLGYEVELVTLNFGIFDSFKPAAESAALLGFKHHVLNADTKIIENATNIILDDGFPNNGINYIHKEALNIVSSNYNVVADGTRRDDRVPMLDQGEINSLEGRKNIEYLNLCGFGHKTINNLSNNLFHLKKEQSNMENNSDYEIEIRYFINQIKGKDAADKIFPAHVQSRVTGWKDKVNHE
ncbi:MAG: DUF7411 family protein [Methanobacterium sp.]